MNAKPRNPNRPIAVDLFAGAGGLSLGLEQAGFDVVAAVEIDPIHCAVHEFNFPDCAVVCRSVADLTGDELRRRAGVGDASVDLVAGGPPCQGFSMMGKRAFDDPRNGLVRHYLRLVVELGARYFVFENVKGLTVGAHRRFLDELVEEFAAAGYDVARPWRVLNAADYGVPQSRERLFLLGARKGLRLPAYPEPTGTPVPTVGDALGDIPDAEDFDELRDSDSVRARFGKPSAYAARLRGVIRDADDFSHPRAHDAGLLTSSLRAEHTELSRQRFAATKPGTIEPVSRFFKLAADGISNTLRAGTASDRGAFTSPRPIHPVHARCVTVREMARLHSYPDWFRFHATKWHGARQIGNSVPPLLGRAVASAVATALDVEREQPTQAIALGDEALLRVDMSAAAERFGVPRATIAQRRRRVPANQGLNP